MEFELEYNGENNDKIQPVMIHKTVRLSVLLVYCEHCMIFIASDTSRNRSNPFYITLRKLDVIWADSEIYSKNDSLNKKMG